jgi:hypothetical protein
VTSTDWKSTAIVGAQAGIRSRVAISGASIVLGGEFDFFWQRCDTDETKIHWIGRYHRVSTCYFLPYSRNAYRWTPRSRHLIMGDKPNLSSAVCGPSYKLTFDD